MTYAAVGAADPSMQNFLEEQLAVLSLQEPLVQDEHDDASNADASDSGPATEDAAASGASTKSAGSGTEDSSATRP